MEVQPVFNCILRDLSNYEVNVYNKIYDEKLETKFNSDWEFSLEKSE